MRVTLPVLAALVVLAVAAPGAHAVTIVRPFHEPNDQELLARYLPVARAAWPDSPCAGREDVTFGDPEAVAGGRAWADECRVVIVPDMFHGAGFCAALVHELGHLAGYYDPVGVTRLDGAVDHNHSPDPASIMWVGAPLPIPAACHDVAATPMQRALVEVSGESGWLAGCWVIGHLLRRCTVWTSRRARTVDIGFYAGGVWSIPY